MKFAGIREPMGAPAVAPSHEAEGSP
jgi:hypothetical protein